MCEKAAETLRRKHVEVRFGAGVARYDGEKLELQGGETIPTRTVVWAAGARATPLADGLGMEQDELRRIRVAETLRIASQECVFVIGDAASPPTSGRAVPMMAPVAIQQGRLAARNVVHLLRGEPLEHFRYRDPGSLATIGRNAAVARLGRFEFHGFLAWLLWLAVHLVQLIGFRNRLIVLVNSAWDYFLYERATRLITAEELHAPDSRRSP